VGLLHCHCSLGGHFPFLSEPIWFDDLSHNIAMMAQVVLLVGQKA